MIGREKRSAQPLARMSSAHGGILVGLSSGTITPRRPRVRGLAIEVIGGQFAGSIQSRSCAATPDFKGITHGERASLSPVSAGRPAPATSSPNAEPSRTCDKDMGTSRRCSGRLCKSRYRLIRHDAADAVLAPFSSRGIIPGYGDRRTDSAGHSSGPPRVSRNRALTRYLSPAVS